MNVDVVEMIDASHLISCTWHGGFLRARRRQSRRVWLHLFACRCAGKRDADSEIEILTSVFILSGGLGRPPFITIPRRRLTTVSGIVSLHPRGVHLDAVFRCFKTFIKLILLHTVWLAYRVFGGRWPIA